MIDANMLAHINFCKALPTPFGGKVRVDGPKAIIGHLLNDPRNVPGGMLMEDGTFSAQLGFINVTIHRGGHKTC